MQEIKEIQTLFEGYKNAVFQKDLQAFASLFDEKVRVFDNWEQWVYDGLAAWREMARGWFSSLGTDRDVVTFDDIQIQVTGEMAVACAFVRFTNVSDNGEELRYLENRLTWVARKSEQGWKIIHQHTSSPVDFKTMKVMLKR
jgi:uncharacterized protein (TIGR02246 family)